MVETAILTLLNGVTGLSGVVGTQIYPESVPQGITGAHGAYQLISSKNTKHLRGTGNLTKAEFQVDFYSLLESDVKSAAEFCRDFFRNGYVGTIGNFAFQWCWFDDERGDFVPLNTLATEQGLFRSINMLAFWYGRVDR